MRGCKPWPVRRCSCWCLRRPRSRSSRIAAGRIKVVTGSAFIVRSSGTVAARAGDEVFASDALQTGADGSLGVTLKDDTRVSLGPSSEVRLERYVYAPDSGALGMVLHFVRRHGAYISGRMAKMAPDSIRLETPAAIVGVRGTTLAINVDEYARLPRTTNTSSSMRVTRLMALTAVIAGSLECVVRLPAARAADA